MSDQTSADGKAVTYSEFKEQYEANTFRFFQDIWIENTKQAKKRFGSFADFGVGKLHGLIPHKPAVIIGSGPSLTKNYAELLRAKKQGITTISCLHNYPYLLDRGIVCDYYVTIDALELVTNQISDGGKESRDYYIESTKDKKLIAATWTHPRDRKSVV